jgi:hypothetical protein
MIDGNYRTKEIVPGRQRMMGGRFLSCGKEAIRFEAERKG